MQLVQGLFRLGLGTPQIVDFPAEVIILKGARRIVLKNLGIAGDFRFQLGSLTHFVPIQNRAHFHSFSDFISS